MIVAIGFLFFVATFNRKLALFLWFLWGGIAHCYNINLWSVTDMLEGGLMFQRVNVTYFVGWFIVHV